MGCKKSSGKMNSAVGAAQANPLAFGPFVRFLVPAFRDLTTENSEVILIVDNFHPC